MSARSYIGGQTVGGTECSFGTECTPLHDCTAMIYEVAKNCYYGDKSLFCGGGEEMPYVCCPSSPLEKNQVCGKSLVQGHFYKGLGSYPFVARVGFKRKCSSSNHDATIYSLSSLNYRREYGRLCVSLRRFDHCTTRYPYCCPLCAGQGRRTSTVSSAIIHYFLYSEAMGSLIFIEIFTFYFLYITITYCIIRFTVSISCVAGVYNV